MRTCVEIVARAGRAGTVLPVLRSTGQLAVRRTGAATVHLVSTAFGPLGGDEVDIRLVVEHGATLAVRSVAAAVALPARGGREPSVQRIRATVDGSLDLRLEPTVVAARAHHVADLVADLSAESGFTATEQVLLAERAKNPVGGPAPAESSWRGGRCCTRLSDWAPASRPGCRRSLPGPTHPRSTSATGPWMSRPGKAPSGCRCPVAGW